MNVSDDLDSHCVPIFTHSHFINPPRDCPLPLFVGHMSDVLARHKKHLIKITMFVMF